MAEKTALAIMLADQLKRDQLCLDPTHWKVKYLADSLTTAMRSAGLSLASSPTAADLDKDVEIARLREALQPFADYADPHNTIPPSIKVTAGSGMARKQITMGDCYNARAALTKGQVDAG